MTFSANDHAAMARALQLAEQGLNTTPPNPRVGCVLVKDGHSVGEGWHQKAGEPHAEIHALRTAGEAARGATAYVTLEPCAHFGRTPPCADALIQAGVKQVIAAVQDPNPLVAGQGLARLRAAGIDTRHGLLAAQANELNIGFITRMQTGRPWVRLKAAASLDGKTALNNGMSQWITGSAARQDGHRWRARACAIMTGIGTVIADNPKLNVREIPCERQPLRIVIDPRLEIAPTAAILQGAPIIIVTANETPIRHIPFIEQGHSVQVFPTEQGKFNLPLLLQALAQQYALNEIHVEAGQRLNGALLQAGCVDELLLYLAPILTGEQAQGLFNFAPLTHLDQAISLDIKDLRTIGKDLRVIARPVFHH